MVHILVIDDDPLFRELFAESFKLIDYQTTGAANGRTGLDLVDELRPDLVLVDLYIPQISGFEVIRHIRADPKYQQIKIVAITGNALAQDAPEMKLVDIFVLKPIEIQVLLQQIQALFTEES